MRDTVIRVRFVAHAVPLLLAVLVFMVGCPWAHAGQGYEFLKNRPLPKTPAERASECAWIRSEEARVRSQADVGASTTEKYSPAMAQSMKAEASQVQAQLELRYTQIQCDLVPVATTQPAVPVPPQAPAPPVLPVSAQAAAQPVVPLPAQTAAQPVVPLPAQTAAQPAAPLPAQTLTATAPAAIQPVTRQAPAEAVAAPPCPGGLTFDQCFAKCRELTKRTAEQCFDTCRH